MGAQNSGMAAVPDDAVPDQKNDSSITTAVSMAPVTSARPPFVQPDDDQRIAQAGSHPPATLLAPADSVPKEWPAPT